ncbi:hypothetical protein ACLOJK_017834 [Asimina triloba]
MAETAFDRLSEDVLLIIFLKLQGDPRNWACLACVCTKFSSLVRDFCWKKKCAENIPSIVSDLLSAGDGGSTGPPGGWASLHKLAICCPGLLHAGVLLENSDFGLERDIGPDENYLRIQPRTAPVPSPSSPRASAQSLAIIPSPDSCWSLFDDLYFDTVYDVSEAHTAGAAAAAAATAGEMEAVVVSAGRDCSVNSKKRKQCCDIRSHLASEVWNLSREQGNKLLASRFRGDCLYICDWPGCVHAEEKRDYMLFRGVFKNFKRSRVWRSINDTNRSKIALDCAFCSCRKTWDLHSAFCLKRIYGYHDDGEPVVRAYVCENGHVSGAWTKRPIYLLKYRAPFCEDASVEVLIFVLFVIHACKDLKIVWGLLILVGDDQYLKQECDVLFGWGDIVSLGDIHEYDAQLDQQEEVEWKKFVMEIVLMLYAEAWLGDFSLMGVEIGANAEAFSLPLVHLMIPRIPDLTFCGGGRCWG